MGRCMDGWADGWMDGWVEKSLKELLTTIKKSLKFIFFKILGQCKTKFQRPFFTVELAIQRFKMGLEFLFVQAGKL